MKTKSVVILFAIGFTFLITVKCQGNQLNSSDENILSILKKFYTSYINEFAKTPPNLVKIKALKQKYCTAKLLRKIEKEELNYDPFLKAQDVNTEWLKTLSVKKDTTENNMYSVIYTDTYDNSQIVINLIVVKVKKSYKIDSIF